MKNSVHLADLPNLDFINQHQDLVENMDIVRNICSVALAIRDEQNIKVRTPLQKISIIGKNSVKIAPYEKIILDEVNVKEISYLENIEEEADTIVEINFKVVALKFAKDMKEIIKSSKTGQWLINKDKNLEIAGKILVDDEFKIKLKPKDIKNSLPLPSNDFLVKLDLNLTEELKQEGVSRDIVRLIQQNRKNLDLNISQNITVTFFDEKNNIGLQKIIEEYGDYIKSQTLTKEIIITKNENFQATHLCAGKIEQGDLLVGIDL